jgi:hypothetical protein
MRCHDCQPLLLDHLYGLLDPAEAAAVEQHLTGCVGCASARDREARAAGLFARAAMHSFPAVRFVPPAEAVPSSAVPARKPTSVRGRWAVAAAVWALVPATVLPLTWLTTRAANSRTAADAAYARAKTAAGPMRDAVAKNDADVAASEKVKAVVAAWVAAEKAADLAAQDRPAVVRVTRPETVQPGAPNVFAVEVEPRESLGERTVAAEIRDAAGTVLHTQPLVANKLAGPQPVRLPADVWAKLQPGAELFLTVSTTTTDRERGRLALIDPVRLAGPVYATMLVTDRATYRPGDRVRFRSLTLDRATFRPPPHEQALAFSLRTRDGTPVPGTATVYGTTALVRDGETTPVTGPDGEPVRGVGVGELALPNQLPDGDYLLTLVEVPGRGGRSAAITTPVTRPIRVRAGEGGRFTKTITPAAGGPGQPINLTAELKLAGRPVAGADVSAVATVDGNDFVIVRVLDKKTDAGGKARIVVSLPPAKDMPRGDLRVKVTFKHDGAEESVAERIPVPGKDLVVEFFPEGGALVAGVPNRVYVRATSATGAPVGVRGTVSDEAGAVAKVEEPARDALSARGLGVVTFTPQAGAAYRLTLDEVGGRTFPLPAATADGVAMTVLDPVTEPGRPVRVKLVSTADRALVVGAYTRGRLADTKAVAAKAGAAVEVTLLAGADARGGVVRLTVFDSGAGFRPVAERLAFRHPGEKLNLTVGAPVLGDNGVSLPVAAADETGKPAAAILWAAAVRTSAAPGARDRSLPTHFLLAGEVETPDELEHADFLLTDHPAAAAGLDLVLATQGWRRFVEQNPAALAGRSPAAGRLLAMSGAGPVGTDANPAHGRLFEQFWPRYEAAARDHDAARAARPAGSTVVELVAAYDARRRETAELAAAAEAAAAPLVAARGWVNLLAVGLAVAAVGAAAVGLRTRTDRRGLAPLAVAAGGAGTLALLLSLMAPPEMPNADYALDAPPAVVVPPADPAAPPVKGTPAVPPANLAVVNPKTGKVEPPPVFSGVGSPGPAQRLIPQKGDPLFPPPVSPFAPTGGISESDLQKQPGAVRTKSPVPGGIGPMSLGGAVADADPALGRAQALAGGLEPIIRTADPVIADRLRAAIPWVPPMVVREYAAPRPSAGATSDTLLWRPLIVLPSDGRTTLTFAPGDAAGGYEVVVAGHIPDGRIGTVRRVVPGARD